MDEILDELNELESDITNIKCMPMDSQTERIVEVLDNLIDTVTSLARIVQSEQIRNM